MSQPTHQLEHLSELPTVLRSAALHIELYGLAKGWYCSPGIDIDGAPIGERATDIIGACGWAQTGDPILSADNTVVADAVHFIAQRLPGACVDPETGEPDHLETVAAWNDAPQRTAGEVVSSLRRMAADAAEADLLCRYIRENDDHQAYEWGATAFKSYLQELAELRLAVAA